MSTVGAIFQPSFPPERLLNAALAAEAADIDELWLWEDCFREGGFASVGAALAGTDRLRIGMGVFPMPLRNVALLAMEIASIERMFPGRLIVGVGHGVQDWMGQIGARVSSPLTLMREYVPALRSLLASEEVDVNGRYVHMEHVALDWPPAHPMKVLAAGEGPKTLSVTGEVADGTILPAGASTGMLRAAVEHVEAGRDTAARSGEHAVVVFLLAATGTGAETRMEKEFDRSGLEGERRVAALGDDESMAATVRSFFEAGATTVVLQPTADEPDLDGFYAAVGRVSRILR